jgi:hypothetical protein
MACAVCLALGLLRLTALGPMSWQLCTLVAFFLVLILLIKLSAVCAVREAFCCGGGLVTRRLEPLPRSHAPFRPSSLSLGSRIAPSTTTTTRTMHCSAPTGSPRTLRRSSCGLQRTTPELLTTPSRRLWCPRVVVPRSTVSCSSFAALSICIADACDA